MLSHRLTLILVVFLMFGSGCTRRADVIALKVQYPVVQYNGPKEPEKIKIQKTRPEGWVALEDVSKAAVGAVVVSEDWAFYQHKGYDPNQIREAIKTDVERGRFSHGASTITQQVARNIFLNQEKSLFRKVQEIFLAMQMEYQLKKSRILELYLNIAEWGEGIFGIGPASQHYFGKPPSLITAKEGAFLAMLLPSPKRYGQSFRAKRLTDYARETINEIMIKMVQARYLTEEERMAESSKPLSFEQPQESPGLPESLDHLTE